MFTWDILPDRSGVWVSYTWVCASHTLECKITMTLEPGFRFELRPVTTT